jgi:hypothetical protein
MGPMTAAARLPSRRELMRQACRALAGLGLAAGAAATPAEGALELDRVWPERPAPPVAERWYRVDATILLLGVPLLRRAGVGQGYLSFSEIGEPGGRRLALQFAAASDPARAHGLNRAGWIREAVVERAEAPVRAAVLGIMSDSPEHNEQEARHALIAAGGTRFVAIDSASTPGRTRTRLARFGLPDGWSRERLPQAARRILASEASRWRETSWPPRPDAAAPSPFLYALYRALEAAAPETAYVWNEDRYALRLVREPRAGDVCRIAGEIENRTRAGSPPLRFAVWIARQETLPIPLRIELQPRSFLRLTLEPVDPAVHPSSKEIP